MLTETTDKILDLEITRQRLTRWNRSAKVQRAIALVKRRRQIAAKIRAHVDAYTGEAFMRLPPFFNEDTGERIEHPRDLWLAGEEADDRARDWYSEAHELHRANGYDVEPDYCPALMAESAAIAAENDLLDMAEAAFGLDFQCASLELRAKALELFLTPVDLNR